MGTVLTLAYTDAQPLNDELPIAQESMVEEQDSILQENTNGANTRAVNSAVTSGAVYKIRNAISGKYVNVHNGIDATGQVNPNLGSELWAGEFTKNLGNGYTVAQSANMAHQAVINASIGIDDNNNNIDDYLENNVYGLGSVYIAGDANQVVKH